MLYLKKDDNLGLNESRLVYKEGPGDSLLAYAGKLAKSVFDSPDDKKEDKESETSSEMLLSIVPPALKYAYDKSFGQSFMKILNVFGWPENLKVFAKEFMSKLKELAMKRGAVTFATTKALEGIIGKSAVEKGKKVVEFFKGSANAPNSIGKEAGKKTAEALIASGSAKARAEAKAEIEVDVPKLEASEIKTYSSFTTAVVDGVSDQGSPDVVDKLKGLVSSGDAPSGALSMDEIKDLSALSVQTLFVRLRGKFSAETEFKDYLEKLFALRSKLPIVDKFFDYMSANFSKLVNVAEGDIPKLLGMSELYFIETFILSGDAKVVRVIEIVTEEFFPKSLDSPNGAEINAMFVDLYKKKAAPSPAQIAKLAYMIEPSEWESFAKRLS